MTTRRVITKSATRSVTVKTPTGTRRVPVRVTTKVTVTRRTR